MTTSERWRAVVGYEGLYEVSDFGRIKRTHCIRKLSIEDVEAARNLRESGITFSKIGEHFNVTQRAIIKALQNSAKREAHRIPNRILKTQYDNHGYAQVSLCKGGVPKAAKIHSLVMRAFVGRCPIGMEINHMDGNKANPRLDNLEYGTHQWNAIHSRRVLKNKGGIHRGEANKTSKLNNKSVQMIRDMDEWGVKQMVIARCFGVCRDTVRKITKRIYWKHI